jgi:enediyne core biosynthesis thioesterase
VRAYEYTHVVTLDETNALGNVYYLSQLRWQGHCRELFLRDHAPEVLAKIGTDFVLVTTRVSCDYYEELYPFDEVVLRMTLRSLAQNRVTMSFDYVCKDRHGGESLVARGEQQIACMRPTKDGMEPAPIPAALREALAQFEETGTASCCPQSR